jgi:regulator of protease activity HflC (stomatin/prohibitin superfamily)
MFGFRYVKFQPGNHILVYKKGRVVREGVGLSFFYYVPTTSLVSVPIGSVEAPFIFETGSSDFQTLTVQGSLTFRIVDPRKAALLLNFTLDESARRYLSDDPVKLPQRLVVVAQVLTNKFIGAIGLRDALNSSEKLTETLLSGVRENGEVRSLGVEVLGLSITDVKPVAETARALEATAREEILKRADDAIYERRNSSVEQERRIKENELNTEIAVENKKRQIRETQMDAEMAVQQKKQEIDKNDLLFRVTQENERKKLVALASENARAEADMKAYAVKASMDALAGASPSVIQALAAMGMDSSRLVALAFQEMAGRADKIGQLNVSPDLLRELMSKGK